MPTPKKKSRRARGSGSIFHDARRGVWVGRVPHGRIPVTLPSGAIVCRTRYREVSHADQRQCVELMKSLAPPGPTVTVAEWAVRWLDSIKHRAPLYRDNCARSVRFRIGPALGSIQLRSLTTYQVELAIQAWGAKLGPNTVLMTIRHLTSLCRTAIRSRLLTENPVASAPRPRAVKTPIYPFTTAELQAIIAAASERPASRPVAVLAATGARAGEVVALDATDYDPATGLLTISKGERLQHGIGPPKTQNSNRVIRIPDAAQPALEAARSGRGRGPMWVVDGARQTRAAIQWQWKKVLRACGVRYRNPHQCRHTVASQMLANGASPADVARYLGDHVETIVSCYMHPTNKDPSLVMDRLLAVGKRKRRA